MLRNLVCLCLFLYLVTPGMIRADLVAHWSLDDGSGDVAVDNTGNGHDGALIDGPEWVEGLYGGALRFGGSPAKVDVPYSPDLNPTEFTASVWANVDPIGSEYRSPITSRDDGPQRGYIIYVEPSNTWSFWTGPGWDNLAGPAVVMGEWTHVAATYANEAKKLYVNGELVAEGTAAMELNTQRPLRIGAGQTDGPGNYFFVGLIDDVAVFNHALTQNEIQEVMQGIGAKELASKPTPEDAIDDVVRDPVLSWTPGEYAAMHNVYVGASFDEVDSATVPTASGLNVSSFEPGRLDFGTTYYWRVDEVNGTPDRTVYKGEVWSFTVEPYSIMVPVDPSKVTASSSAAENPPSLTVNGSGLDGDTHSTESDDIWLSAMPDLTPWLMYELDGLQKLDQMLIWNANSASEPFVGWGIKDVNIETSIDGVTWTSLTAEPSQISQAPGLPTYDAPHVIDFNLVQAQYVRINILNNWGGVVMQYGVSEVQFYGLPVQARMPDPASGSAGVLPGSTASWRAGREADQHTIYVSTDANAVADDSASSVTSNTNSVSLNSLDLELGRTYYWRVDEVNEAEVPSTWAGPVWSLSTVEAVIVDDFERYNNFSPDRPFQAWIDGVGYSADEFYPVANPGNGTGAAVGHDIWSPTSPHYNGKIMEENIAIAINSQSLPFYYSNTGGAASHIDRTFGVPQDWAAGAAETLVLWIRGELSNASSNTLYVMINNTKVTYEGDISVPIWKQWNIDLTSLGANLSTVSTLSIGVEGGGTGLVYLDDIALYRVAPPVTELPAGSDPSLVGYWALDETEGLTAADSSGYGNDGTLVGMDGTEWTTGTKGGALALNGAVGNPEYVDCANSTSLQLSGSVTISAWAKMDAGTDALYMGIGGKLKTAPYQGFSLVRHSSGVFRLWADNGAGDIAGFDASSDATYTDTEWHQVVGVVDDGLSTLYVDGVKQAKQGEVSLTDSGEFVHIGRQYSGLDDRYWNGLIDEFRIYYRALSEQEISDL